MTKILQQWEGHVIEVGGDTFWARLYPLIGQPGEHMAQIKFSEIADQARWLVEPGRIFYWSIDDAGNSTILFYRVFEAEVVLESRRYWFHYEVPKRSRELAELLGQGRRVRGITP